MKTTRDFKSEFLINPDITFLNHGSFGAVPKAVFEKYQDWQLQLERQPVEFLGRNATGLLEIARSKLADYLKTEPDNLVFVTNATIGINIITSSLKLTPGDEVLTSNHEYGAMDRSWQFQAEKHGFTYKVQPISTPIESEQQIVDQLWNAVTPHTKVIFLSHITSPTALIFPIKAICRKAKEHGILTVMDGAHAPGQIDLNLDDLGADFYTGNLHKWLCAPKGSGFLFVRPENQHLIEPLIVSWGWRSETPGKSTFVDHHEWQGTRDISAFLTVPSAIQYQQENHWDIVRSTCHETACYAYHQLSHLTSLPPLYPDSRVFYDQMGIARLPSHLDADKVKNDLYDHYKIEIPIIKWNAELLIRYSLQCYNNKEDIDKLIIGLRTIIKNS